MDDINLKFVIKHTFHSELADADELERAKFRDLKARLYNYAITLNRLLEMNDGPEVENEDLVKLPLIANLHRVEISREFKDEMYQTIKNCAQTLVVGVKDDITLEKLNKIRPPAIAETNLTSD
jgi:RNase P subunit RPR2